MNSKTVAALLLWVAFAILCVIYDTHPYWIILPAVAYAAYWTLRKPVVRAWIKCEFHCLCHGVIHGHCPFIARDQYGKVNCIAAVTGSLFDGSLKFEKIFYGGPVDPGRFVKEEPQEAVGAT